MAMTRSGPGRENRAGGAAKTRGLKGEAAAPGPELCPIQGIPRPFRRADQNGGTRPQHSSKKLAVPATLAKAQALVRLLLLLWMQKQRCIDFIQKMISF
jgi:hypothetical protein